jgi:hypothetical protein
MVYLHTRENHCGKIGSAYLFSSLPRVFVFRFVLRFSIHLIPFLALNLCVRRGLKAQIAKASETSPDERFFVLKIFNESKVNIFFFQEGWK